MSRQTVRERFGPPATIEEMVKASQHIFGPVETFWYQQPMGTRIEIWSYPSRRGQVQLYFANGGDLVDGIGFADADAVY